MKYILRGLGIIMANFVAMLIISEFVLMDQFLGILIGTLFFSISSYISYNAPKEKSK